LLKILGTVPSLENVRAMSIARIFKMLAVFVTLVSVSSWAILSLGAVSVTSTQTVLASKRYNTIEYHSFSTLFRNNPEACFCEDGFCRENRWECHENDDCDKLSKCDGLNCTCSGRINRRNISVVENVAF
jgi:hypothetical protein